MTPEAVPRDCAVMRCAHAPINTEKLAAPEPIALTTPRVNMSPKPLANQGVNAYPSANKATPHKSTMRGPCRSAMAPATGWMGPQTNCPNASAKLMLAIPIPVLVLMGPTYSPMDWRVPMVTIKIPEAKRVVHKTVGSLNALNMANRWGGGPSKGEASFYLDCGWLSRARQRAFVLP